jgi:hypothetical protein
MKIEHNHLLHPITQEEIDELKSRFPIDGKRKNKTFKVIIIQRLLDECERLLKENKS